MKKLLFLFFAVLLLVCCTERLAIEDVPDSPTNEHYVSIGQALGELDGFLSALNVTTRAEGVTRRYSEGNVTTVHSKDIFVGTRGSDVNEDIPAEMLYIVNFDDGLGGAVLSADDRVSDIVLCVTESGSFSVSDFVAAGELLLSDGAGSVSVRSDGGADDGDGDGDDDDDYYEDLGELIVPTLLLASYLQRSVPGDDDNLIIGGGLGAADRKYGPYTTTKWGQHEIGKIRVFNRFTPNNACAGCVVIAVAQILLATKPESYVFTYDGCDCIFGTMLTVANYTDPTDAGTEEAQVQTGKFVRGLGESEYCNISYGSTEKSASSGSISGAINALEAFGYNNVKQKDYNQSSATSQIREGCPIYFQGMRAEGSGHAWVLDGEWGDYYHVNWGWNGRSDGYFTKGVFNAGDRATYDNTIDKNTYSSALVGYNFTLNFKMITYSE